MPVILGRLGSAPACPTDTANRRPSARASWRRNWDIVGPSDYAISVLLRRAAPERDGPALSHLLRSEPVMLSAFRRGALGLALSLFLGNPAAFGQAQPAA